MDYTPRIVMEVECIVGSDDPRREEARTHGQFIIDFGAKFIISEIILWPRIDAITLQFTTLRSEGRKYPGFLAECFRPIVKRATDISVFTQLLVDPATGQELITHAPAAKIGGKQTAVA